MQEGTFTLVVVYMFYFTVKNVGYWVKHFIQNMEYVSNVTTITKKGGYIYTYNMVHKDGNIKVSADLDHDIFI